MSTLSRQWLWPIALAVATVFALLAALIGEGGIWQAVSCLTLASLLLLLAYHSIATKKTSHSIATKKTSGK